MRRFARPGLWARPSTVAALYLLAALVMTWPLAAVMTSRIAGDTGDTLFNCWILLWTSGQALRALGGDIGALGQYWNANIFHPAPLTLAYSEHLTPQMLQALPILGLTANITLAYNLLFLGTIVLSGLGVYILVRDLTGHPLAAFVGGLAFAFAPYRIDQFEHLQVLSSQWMPFAFVGLRRFIATGRLRTLAGGAAAVAAEALSCGYYLAYFTPFVVAFAIYEMAAHNKLTDARTWRGITGAGAAVLIVVAAFLWPHLWLRQHGDVGVREIAEIESFSADTHAFATVSTQSRLWGSRIRAMPHAEGQGFMGFAIMTLAAAGIVGGVIRARERARARPMATPRLRKVVAALALVFGLLVLLLGIVLVRGPDVVSIGGLAVRYGSDWLLAQIAAVAGALLLVSLRFRALMRGVRGSPVAFFAWAAVAAAWMSLGPTMYANGKRIGPGLYDLFYRWVPGFTGLRVPSLSFMIVAFMLAVLAGLGAAFLLSRPGRGVLVAIGAIGILLEGAGTSALSAIPPRGPVYDAIRALPADAVVAEFPFGEVGSEIRYTFFSGYHRKPIVNGYSGFFPAAYVTLVARLSPVPHDSEGWTALLASGATHAVVHEHDYDADRAHAAVEWMRQHGAKEIGRFDGDRLFQLSEQVRAFRPQ
jgi:hypothetical protein